MPNAPVDFIYLAANALYCTDKQQGIYTKCHLPKGENIFLHRGPISSSKRI